MKIGEFLKVSEACKIFGVSPATIGKWFDAGLISGHRLPGRNGPRRLNRDSVVAFAQQRGVPLPAELQTAQPDEIPQ